LPFLFFALAILREHPPIYIGWNWTSEQKLSIPPISGNLPYHMIRQQAWKKWLQGKRTTEEPTL
jgi:hypothetical protein